MNLSLSAGSLTLRRRELLRAPPTVVFTPDDWIADVVETRPDGTRNRYRMGISPHHDMDGARAVVERVLRFRGAVLADVTMWRRRDSPSDLPTGERMTRSVRGDAWRR